MNDQTGYDATIQLPEGASTLAPHVDSLYYDIYWISVAFFVAIVGCMVWFAYRFRRKKGVKSKPPGHHTALELFWTFSPLLLLGYMFHQGFDGFMRMSIAPENALNIRAEARQWSWTFIHPSGRTEGEMTVPIHRPVRVIMSSHPRGASSPAVLHSFFVPALRVKRDIVPGMYTSLWFEATRLGTYDIYCAEYCGLDPIRGELTDAQLHANGRPLPSSGHSGMLSRLHVVSAEEWVEFDRVGIPARFNGDHVAWGEEIFGQHCTACHVIEAGQPATVGPNLANVVGYDQPLAGGGSHMADLDYMRESIREPGAAIVAGFESAAMPSFSSLPEANIDALIQYLASRSDRGAEVIAQLEASRQE
ncbi:MAG: c-type cytochrome [Sandaracinaceae bacterium]|nr:c-type cytochrome [Sandaracinaceae bacterium]